MKLLPPIECCRIAGAGLVTLSGATEQGGRACLTIEAEAPAYLPSWTEEGAVEQLDERRYRVSMPGHECIIEATRSFVHEDVSDAFYAALPPRRVPLGKRLFWRLVLSAAASRAARWWSAR
ncbi:MAG: hypothetical protein ACREUG_01135 [Steroidobacteraceae bacterium]